MPADSLAVAVDSLPAAWTGHYFDTVDSTQDVARAAARDGAPGRSLFVADYQSAGRGRHARTWLAAPGTALLMSILFREAHADPRPWRFTSLASIALLESLQPVVPGRKLAVKWPNDVMLDDKKLAGVLAETSWNGHDLQAIVGLGLNVTTSPALPGVTHLGQVDRGQLLLRLVARLDHWLGRPDGCLVAAWQACLWRRGQRLRLLDLGRDEHVTVLGADADGSLRVCLADGTERRTVTGELLA
jgi:BirA family transcriptional regulator, biotin operon repressor / biotin---[acetyl-CoA-carboxylase] ligase